MSVFSLRVPSHWRSRIDSETVRRFLVGFLQRPRNLPVDPGPGEGKISLSLPARAVKVLSGLVDDTESGALRRLIAENIRALPAAKPVPRLLAPRTPAVVQPSSWASPAITPGVSLPAYGRILGEPVSTSWLEPFPTSDPRPLQRQGPADSSDFWEQHPLVFTIILVGGILAGLALLIWLLGELSGGASAPSVPASGPVPVQFKGWNPVV